MTDTGTTRHAGRKDPAGGPGDVDVVDERQRRLERRLAVAAAARAHSEAVARHLDRVVRRARSGPPDGPAGAVQRLTGLSTLLLAHATPGALLRTVLDLAVAAVPGADGASVTLRRDAGFETAAASDRDVAEADRAQYDLGEGPCLEAADRGEAMVAPGLPDPRWPAFGARARELGWAGVIGVPLSTDAGSLGALNLYARRPGMLADRSLAVAQALAEQIAVALTNARDFRHQQDVAAALQRSLLPADLPTVPELVSAAVYRPATSGINVGGDWYDVLPLSEGRLALVVGDVGGHGLDAAMTMGQLRTAVRAYALEGHPPHRVLELVDAFLQRLDADGYATCLYLVLEPATGAVEWCSAGHPGPVLVARGGGEHDEIVTTLADEGRVPSLGVPVPAALRAGTGRAVLPPGSRLLLFTDGLVERRGESLEVGLERLARHARRPRARGDLTTWCETLVDLQLDGRDVDDDVAVLAVELQPSRGALPPPGTRVG